MMASTSCKQTPTSSVSTSSPPRWDVFLSFRGFDTRYTFIGHLYAALDRTGILTFMDDRELQGGDLLSCALPRAIYDSKTYIVVFSENYASSYWCLDELVEILTCHKTFGRLVIPVFYNIDACVVRHQIGSFKEPFRNYQLRFAGEMEKVNKWRLTLTQVSDFTGKIISAQRSEADIVTEIVDWILTEINPRTLYVAKYPIGLDSRVEDVTALLSNYAEGRYGVGEFGETTLPPRKIGIYGMGGVGKTTLAKAVYNKNYNRFEGSCFLANVREVSKRRGLEFLQQQLINSVLKCQNIIIDNVDQGIKLIRARICSIKVLVVIDDLDDSRQLNFLEGPFALGSILIVTTRNEDLLDLINVESKYKVNELGDAESYQLFTQHAFRDDKISDTQSKLSKEIIEFAGGLPLALEVFGSKLLNQKEEGWRCFIDILKRVSIDDVHAKLLISFNTLGSADYPMLPAIFLDIACFFIGLEEKKVVKIMQTCYDQFIDHYINILKKRCLLTINNGDKLGMHPLHRDMGRAIVRNNSPDPGKHSRLWVSNDICDVLKKQKGTEEIEGIIPSNLCYKDALEGVSFDMETFKNMTKLRFLYLRSISLTGSFEQKFEVLKFLHWRDCPLECLPSDFYPQQLVILELPHSKIITMWKLNMDSQVFEKLKTLNMSHSLNLSTTPDFTKLKCLETLNLEGCKNLKEVDISIGSLVGLVTLNLRRCVKLTNLPDTICNLRSLENLELTDCRHLLSIADHLPPNLKWLWASCCKSMNRLPNLSNLKQLEILELTNCLGLTRILGLEELTSITRLHLGGCSSSLLAYTFTRGFFQKYSGFGHQIQIYTASAEFPDWISQSNDLGSTVSLNLPSQVLHNFLAIIVCFKHRDNNSYRIDCSLRNATSGFVWSHNLYTLDCNESWMVIVPRSICPVIDGNNRIELRTTNADVLGYHLLHSTTVTVEDERSCPSKRLKHLESDEKSYPSKRLKHLESDD